MSAAPATAWVVGTFDTKAAELSYIASLLRAAGLRTVTVDIGTRSPAGVADINAREVASHHPDGAGAVFDAADRGVAVIAMSQALCALVRERLATGTIAGMLGVGGSGGSSMIAPAMRLLPIGVPKLLVSTMAAGDVSAYVGVTDMTLMYPVTDIAGLNRLSRTVLANAAHALAGMLLHHAPPADTRDKPSIGLTMFGVTTPCVQAVRDLLADEFDTQVFHANGAGGRTLEALAAAGMLRAVVDITTTEVGQHLAGGVCDAGPNRLDAAARHGLPWVGSVGALDMINWGAQSTVPERHRGRTFHVHNADVTLMRSNTQEMQAAAQRIAAQLNQATGPVRLLLPLGGLSMLDAPGQPFHDPQANAAFFAVLQQHFVVSDTHHLIALPHHINDPAFSAALAYALRAVGSP
ncbi:MAG: Tm-1-like ATP-binding domain-containing protein [Pseudomonadota bacterium]